VLKVFSYGTLKDPNIQLQLFNRTIQGRSAKINNWILFTNIEGYFCITQGSDTIYGTILELTKEEIKIADKYEEGYSRIETIAEIIDGNKESVFVYVA